MSTIMMAEPDFTKLQMSTNTLNEWFESSDISGFLNNEISLDFQNLVQTPTTPESITYFSPEQVFSGSDNSAYSSDSSETSSPFDQFSADNIHSGVSSPVDETLFESYNITDPSLVPEIEKILACNNTYQMEVQTPVAVPSESGSRKRQRESEPKAPVALSRDQLLTMTSQEIEDYVSNVKASRKLTAAEERELKTQRRKVKNREYASQSRNRKKQFVDDLEKQLEDARAETEEVKKKNQALAEENRILKRQLGSIAETIKRSQLQAGSVAATTTDKANLNQSSSGTAGMLEKFVKVGAGRAATKGVSACLLAIFFMVFTFAAFWENESSSSRSGLDDLTSGYRGGRMLLGMEEPGVWEAASELLRQTWDSAASSLPDWDSAYSLFVSTYPVLFSGSSPASLISSSDSISSPITKASTEHLFPCTEQDAPTLPEAQNKTKNYAVSHASAV